MDMLRRLSKSDTASYYEIASPDTPANDRLKRYVLTTPKTRAICNDPRIFGHQYRSAMKDGLRAALRHFPERGRIADYDQSSVGDLTILRGSLAYPFQELLCEGFGWNNVGGSFITSERQPAVGGGFKIGKRQYTEIGLPKDAVVFIGEIVATGSTLKDARQRMKADIANNGGSLRELYIFTIGGENAELEAARYLKEFPDCERASVVYIEGRFGMATEEMPLRVKKPGTDLLIKPGLLTPEYADSLAESILYPMEGCRIYDGGSRAFSYGMEKFKGEVIGYWKQEMTLADDGLTLESEVNERHPWMPDNADVVAFKGARHEEWDGVPDSEIEAIFDRFMGEWGEKIITADFSTPDALRQLGERATERMKKAV